MKQLSSLSAKAAELGWLGDFCRWTALAGNQHQRWSVPRNVSLLSLACDYEHLKMDGVSQRAARSLTSLWQGVISEEEEAADRTELGILQFILMGAPNICFQYVPGPCSPSRHLLTFISGQ